MIKVIIISEIRIKEKLDSVSTDDSGIVARNVVVLPSVNIGDSAVSVRSVVGHQFVHMGDSASTVRNAVEFPFVHMGDSVHTVRSVGALHFVDMGDTGNTVGSVMVLVSVNMDVCVHNVRSVGGSSICVHGRRRSHCTECWGSSICEHGRRHSRCKECDGTSICEHGRQRQRCKICDPNGHLSSIVSCRIRHALNRDKDERSIEYLGCDIEFYRCWLEMQFKPGMSWDNHGNGEGCWHIDHKVPVMYKGDGEVTLDVVKERLHYRNTHPLWASENLSKSNKFKH